MNSPTKDQNELLAHDENEPDREGEASKPSVVVERPIEAGGRLSFEFNGLKVEAVGASLAECRAYLLDVLIFVKENLKPNNGNGGGYL